MKKILTIYWLLTASLFTLLITYLSYGISLNGYWSDKIFFAIWLIFTTAIIAIKIRERWTKFYLASLIMIIILSMLPMMIPFISLVTFVTANDREINLNLNSEIRLEEAFTSPVVSPQVLLIESLGPFEKIIGYTDSEFYTYDSLNMKDEHLLDYMESFTLKDAKTIEIIENTENSKKIKFIFEKGETTVDFSK